VPFFHPAWNLVIYFGVAFFAEDFPTVKQRLFVVLRIRQMRGGEVMVYSIAVLDSDTGEPDSTAEMLSHYEERHRQCVWANY